MANLLRQVVDFLSQRLLSSSRQQLGGLSQLRVGRLTDVRAFRTSPLRTFPKVKKKPDALRVPSTKSAGPEGCPTVDKALAMLASPVMSTHARTRMTPI